MATSISRRSAQMLEKETAAAAGAWAAASALVLMSFYTSSGWGSPVAIVFIFTVLPFIIVGAAAQKWPVTASRFAVGVAVMLLIATAVTSPRLGFLLLFGTLFGDLGTLTRAVFLVATQAIYTRFSKRRALHREQRRTPHAFVAGMLCFPALLGAAYGTRLVVDHHSAVREQDSWDQARTRIFQATSCVLRSRDAAGKFPSSAPAQCGFDEGD